MNKILVIEDEPALREELIRMLGNSGYTTEALTDFSDTLERMRSSSADLILLDIGLPGMNGEALLSEFRSESTTPVIMLTSRTSELDEVLSMSYGADDYITKPYNPTILLLRISAVLKRTSKAQKALSYRGLTLSLARGTVSNGTASESLTKNELLIFNLLLDRRGEIVTRDDLMTVLWDNEEYVNDNALSVNISRLRSKLAVLGQPNAIETRKKQGYVLI